MKISWILPLKQPKTALYQVLLVIKYLNFLEKYYKGILLVFKSLDQHTTSLTIQVKAFFNGNISKITYQGFMNNEKAVLLHLNAISWKYLKSNLAYKDQRTINRHNINPLQSYNQFYSKKTQMQTQPVVSSEPIKNYYEILGVNRDATMRDIENAYQKLSLKWHPDKHTVDRRLAQRKFNEISEAFECLSDANRRSTYNRMISQKSSLENAYQIFDRFFGQNEMIGQDEEKFFETHFPDKKKNYYKILGVNKNASMQEITNAYRKLALKYHPKSNPNNEEAQRKFVEVNEAYQTLSNQLNRSNYDDLLFREIVPRRAFDIFQNFFEDRWMDMPSQTDFFKPIFSRKRPLEGWGGWSGMNRPLLGIGMDGGMDGNRDLSNIKQGQCYLKEEKFERKNGKENHTSQVVKKKVRNGEVEEEILKENILPNGEKDVEKTVKRGDKVVDTKKYHLKRNEDIPRQLTNF